MDYAFKQIREQALTSVQEKAKITAEERILDILLPSAKHETISPDSLNQKEDSAWLPLQSNLKHAA